MTLIYGLAHPVTGELRYVGKTSQTLSARLNRHRVRARSATKIRVAVWIRALLEAGQQPDIFVIEDVEPTDWMQAEQFWVAYFRSWGVDLLNMTIGGGSTEGHRHAPETIAKLKEIVAKQWSSPEARQRQSEKALKAWARDDVRKKTSEAQKALMTLERRTAMGEARRRQWAEDASYRANVVAAQQLVDRMALAKEFWKRPEYQARQVAARDRRRARGWNVPAAEQ